MYRDTYQILYTVWEPYNRMWIRFRWITGCCNKQSKITSINKYRLAWPIHNSRYTFNKICDTVVKKSIHNTKAWVKKDTCTLIRSKIPLFLHSPLVNWYISVTSRTGSSNSSRAHEFTPGFCSFVLLNL